MRDAKAAGNSARLLDLHRLMRRIRAFEETAVAAHQAGEIPGPLTSPSARKPSPPACA